jgi:predicted transcriptional regulator
VKMRRGVGAVGGQDGSGRNRIAHFSNPATGDHPSELRRFASHDGIERKQQQADLNDTERLVHRILDDEFVTAREIAACAGISVEQCRRALATLRTLGMAELERPRRKNATNVWRRA